MNDRLDASQGKVDNEGARADISIIFCTPALTVEDLDIAAIDKDAVILIAYASGTTPDRLLPAIKNIIDSGKAVILISNNPGDSMGVVHMQYAAGSGALAAGAVLLQKANINHLAEVEKSIIDAIRKGKKGRELAQYIKDQYSFQPGEEVPPAEWDTREGIEKQRELTRQTFRRIGMPDDKVEEELKRWEFGDGTDPHPTNPL